MRAIPGAAGHLWQTGLVIVAAVAATLDAGAQEALNVPLFGERAAIKRRRALENLPYNLKLGPVSVLLDAGLSVELNDNITLSETDRQQDVILSPQITATAVWPVTVRNTLSLNVTAGYESYLVHPEYSQFVVQPGSSVSFDVYIDDFIVTFYNQFSYTKNPNGPQGVVSQGGISGVAQYGGIYNNVGFGVNWYLNELLLSFNYDHFNFISSVQQFDYLSRGTDTILTRATFLPRSGVQWGPELGGGHNQYSENILNSSWNFTGGAFLDWTVSEHLNLVARGGYSQYYFSSGGQVGSTPNNNGFYLTLNVNQTVNDSISHGLSGGRSIDLGVTSDLTDLLFVRYSASFDLIRNVRMQAYLTYEHGRDVGGSTQIYDLSGGSLSFWYQPTRKLRTVMRYSLSHQSSSIPSGGYLQNVLALEASYRF